MAAQKSKIEDSWRTWNSHEWNRLLFDHFFSSRDDIESVNRIAVSDSLLRRISEDLNASPEEVGHAFRDAIRQDLRGENIAKAALRASYCSIGTEFVYLAATCYAATHAVESGVDANFRRRLNEFLGEGMGNERLDLNDLPDVWERFKERLDWQINRGSALRRLALPARRGRRLIGYSLGLAFPSHRDHCTLVEVLSSEDFSASPPVRRVLQTLGRRLYRFGQRFQEEYMAFRTSAQEAKGDLHELPFWGAVLDAVDEAHSDKISRFVDRATIKAVLRLDIEFDWRFGLSVLLSGTPDNPFGVVEAGEFAIDDCDQLLCVLPNSTSPGQWVLEEGHSSDLFIGVPGLQKTLEQGVLLFEPVENEAWLLRTSMPTGNRIRALLRSDIDSQVGPALVSVGAQRQLSRYRNWVEFDRITADTFVESRISELLPDVDVLQPTVVAPRVSIRGGIRTIGGYLGIATCRPTVYTSAIDAKVTIRLPDLQEECLCLATNSVGTFALPTTPTKLEGECQLSVWSAGEPKRSKSVTFVGDVITADFKLLSKPEHWLCEGGNVDVAELRDDQRSPDEIGRPDAVLDALVVAKQVVSDADEPNSQEAVALKEILAAAALNRQVLSASEVVSWFQQTLQLDGERTWSAIRSWTESGLIDSLFGTRWRCHAYRVRRPRFVVSRLTNGTLQAVLLGVAPAFIESEVRRSAQHLGATVVRACNSNESVPCPTVVYGPNLECIKAISHLAGLAAPEALQQLSECVTAVKDLQFYRDSLRINHVLYGTWRWSNGGYFHVSSSPISGEIDWYRRKDLPDSFVVNTSDSTSLHTLSKTWALLIGSVHTGRPVINEDSDRDRVCTTSGLSLPLPVGRWSAAFSGLPPAPNQNGGTDYSFASSEARSEAIRILFGANVDHRLKKQLARVQQLVLSQTSCCRTALVPKWINETVAASGEEFGSLARCTRVPRRYLGQLIGIANTIRSQDSVRCGE